MADSFSKKENFKKKLQKQKDKALRREERKTNNDKGKETEFMYVDAYGRLTSTPPEERLEVDLDNIQLGAAPIEAEEAVKTGIVTFVSDKGYGFITENKTNENIFFHSNNCAVPIKKGNKVSFEKERSPKGFSAINIELVK
ncbi:cold-shock protein [Epilithonimonas hungarica]|uniref:Cold shock protein, CspA family n=1 Tax=Epilithonimonas hungarica TaxID=454006 RepID=A0A1G7TWI5_9FLAO|nr:cold shock domain-containing protein [Epilithonimonas hungarica]MDP9955227.1 cold shock CspA family protein [Epilithonimonas hungarica]MPS74494.1 cold shock domain-containing protein [Chryseobacterium sp.]MPT31783.1 cold shock domain-containing protein [Chryseobacterium sp.]SDG39414.1 Cold shock protein, CspA family [Epilithonimonas hungarica]